MMTTFSNLVARSCVLFVLITAGEAAAQGGKYRGPGQLVPPALAPVQVVRMFMVDMGKWEFWWEINKDRFIHDKRARVRGPRPTAKDIEARILPALEDALQNSGNPMIESACLIAMAKIGRTHQKAKLLRIFLELLKSPRQRVRESAALALGIAGMHEAIPGLESLASNTPRSRKLTGGRVLDERTRAFACYALGLIADRSDEVYVKRRVLKTLHAILDAPKSTPDVQVAAIRGMCLLNISTASSVTGRKELLAEVIRALDPTRAVTTRATDRIVDAHVLPTIATLIGRGKSQLHEKFKRSLAQLLRSGLAQNHMSHAATIALGQIGGLQNRAFLMQTLPKGRKSRERAWAALALGVMEYHRLDSDPRATADAEIGRLLYEQTQEKQPYGTRSALALSLGLCRHEAAAPQLIEDLHKYRTQDELAGYLSMGLAMMGHAEATEPIRELVFGSVRRPDLLIHVTVALARLGDDKATEILVKMLPSKESNLSKCSALALSIGMLGDPNAIAPLIGILRGASAPPMSRAFAAAALGALADPERPFHWKIAANVNYRGAVPTLVYRGTGILEIL